MTLWKNLVVTLVAAFALAACSSSDDPAPVAMPDPEPTPQETCEAGGGQWADGACLSAAEVTYNSALAAIAAAETAEDAQAAYDEVKDDVSATQGDALQMAVNTRIAALATMDRQDMQTQALMAAAGMIDTSDLSTQDLVDAARTAIAGLRQAIAAAADVDDTSMYQTILDNAVMAVDDAQGGIDTATRRMNQMDALSSASMALQAALTALSGSTPTQAQLDAANNALTALNSAIADGADLTDTEKAPYQREANNAAAPIQTAQTAFDNAEDEADKTAAAAMAATAAKLYAGISAREETDGGATRNAAYSGTNDSQITVTIGAFQADGTTAVSPTPTHTLSEDDETMVADNHGWEGKRYADPAGGDMVEAIVYSNVEDPTMGKMFGSAVALPTDAALLAAHKYQYQLVDGALALITSGSADAAFNASRVGGDEFDHTAGVKQFMLSTTDGATMRTIPGSYHGVPGSYRCTPGAGNACGVRVAADGFDLGTVAGDNTFTDNGGTWVFIPANASTRVMEVADANYASYGWWIRKAENDGPFTASAFVDVKGTVAAIGDIIDALQGTATYVGGAAGKYALASSTGGTNDAGHFTARATLKADFSNNTDTDAITGTLDMFMGADDQPRDWMVELNGSAIANNGGIGDNSDTTPDNGPMTVWTIGETDAAASGNWTGDLRKLGDDGVPEVATGTFYTEYGTAGKMVGAFGANVE